MVALVARVSRIGAPEVIEWVETHVGEPAHGEVRIRHTAVGLNFIDTYFRRGIYPAPLPTPLGLEAAGVIEAVGDGVTNVAVGDRVAYCWPPLGAYATYRLYPAEKLIRLPDDISDETAAAGLLKACTAEYLVERTAEIAPGDAVLVHAAAGGTGLLLVQWLKALGAIVIGTVSSDAKAALAREHGADHIVRYDREEVAPRVRMLTDGAGVRVVYDGVGKSTWTASLDSLGRRGLLVNFGNADAPVGSVDMGVLATKGSLYNTRPTLWDYYATRAEIDAGAARVFTMIRSGRLRIEIGQRYSLLDAARAHAELEQRATSGSSVLVP